MLEPEPHNNVNGRCHVRLASACRDAGRLEEAVTFQLRGLRLALQPKLAGGNDDGFIVKFTPDLKVAYATYLGGTGGDHIHAIAIGPDDSLYAVGESSSNGMATPGAYVPTMQPYSSFAVHISADGQRLQYFTYIGWRSGYTVARAVAVLEDDPRFNAGTGSNLRDRKSVV